MITEQKFLYVYILKCADKSYYVGVTNNVELRVEQHNSGQSETSYIYSRRPVELVYVEQYQDYNLAVEREKQIKRWTRAKKEALIRENWDKLRALAACKNETSHLNFRDKS
jgi:putative endonuclease